MDFKSRLFCGNIVFWGLPYTLALTSHTKTIKLSFSLLLSKYQGNETTVLST